MSHPEKQDRREAFAGNEEEIEKKKKAIAELTEKVESLERIRSRMVDEDWDEGETEDRLLDEAETAEERARREAGMDNRPIEERLEAPKTEMFEQYGSKMREAAKELVGVVAAMKALDERFRTSEHGSPEWKKAWSEYTALNDRRNALCGNATWGGSVLSLRMQKSGESYDDYSRYQIETLKAYKQTAMQDPQIVLNLAKAGELGRGFTEGEGIGQVSSELRSNREYMARMLDVLDRGKAESFWAHTRGEARQDRDLYLAAIAKNHLNYQFGNDEWKKDPEVQNAALASGLNPIYLKR